MRTLSWLVGLLALGCGKDDGQPCDTGEADADLETVPAEWSAPIEPMATALAGPLDCVWEDGDRAGQAAFSLEVLIDETSLSTHVAEGALGGGPECLSTVLFSTRVIASVDGLTATEEVSLSGIKYEYGWDLPAVRRVHRPRPTRGVHPGRRVDGSQWLGPDRGRARAGDASACAGGAHARRRREPLPPRPVRVSKTVPPTGGPSSHPPPRVSARPAGNSGSRAGSAQTAAACSASRSSRVRSRHRAGGRRAPPRWGGACEGTPS